MMAVVCHASLRSGLDTLNSITRLLTSVIFPRYDTAKDWKDARDSEAELWRLSSLSRCVETSVAGVAGMMSRRCGEMSSRASARQSVAGGFAGELGEESFAELKLWSTLASASPTNTSGYEPPRVLCCLPSTRCREGRVKMWFVRLFVR